MNRCFLPKRPVGRDARGEGLFDDSEYEAVARFHESSPAYRPTPLHRLPRLASHLGVGELFLKDESNRFGHQAFKILGVSFAVERLLESLGPDARPILVAATDGNHGQALARVARERSLSARIYVHASTREVRIDAIRREGSVVTVVAGTYDDAVRAAAEDARRHGWHVVSDTSWDGYVEIPHWIMAGYTQLVREASWQWAPSPQPDIVIVQAGVGGFACSVSSWFARWSQPAKPFIVVCEPSNAACLLESAVAGAPTVVRGDLTTVMEGLSCGEVSRLAWPVIASTVDAFVAIDDQWALEAMHTLSAGAPPDDVPIGTGASGAAGVAALIAILADPALAPVRTASGIHRHSRVLAFNTEGPIGDPFGVPSDVPITDATGEGSMGS